MSRLDFRRSQHLSSLSPVSRWQRDHEDARRNAIGKFRCGRSGGWVDVLPGEKDKREKGLSLNESGKAAVRTTERNNSLWSSLNSTKAILSARSIKGRARFSSPTPGTRDRG